MAKIYNYIELIPLVLISATLLSKFVDFDYCVLGNILGYSLLTNILGYAYFNLQKHQYSLFAQKVWIGLIIINVINILGTYIPYSEYLVLFEIATCSICLFYFIIDRFKWL